MCVLSGISAVSSNSVGASAKKGVGSIMVWMPTDRLSDEDSEFVLACHIYTMMSYIIT